MCETTKEKMTRLDSLQEQVEEILNRVFQGGIDAGEVGYGFYHWSKDCEEYVEELSQLLTPQVEMGEMNNTEDGKRFAILGMAGLLLENGIHDDSTLTINKPVRLAERLYKMVEQYWRIELKRQQLTKEEGK